MEMGPKRKRESSEENDETKDDVQDSEQGRKKMKLDGEADGGRVVEGGVDEDDGASTDFEEDVQEDRKGGKKNVSFGYGSFQSDDDDDDDDEGTPWTLVECMTNKKKDKERRVYTAAELEHQVVALRMELSGSKRKLEEAECKSFDDQHQQKSNAAELEEKTKRIQYLEYALKAALSATLKMEEQLGIPPSYIADAQEIPELKAERLLRYFQFELAETEAKLEIANAKLNDNALEIASLKLDLQNAQNSN